MSRTIEELINASVINVDKPCGPTCRIVDEKIKNILGCKKVGHAGTLDHRVSGVLVVALNEAVKAMPVLMGLDKEYEGIMYLHKDIDVRDLKKIITENFIGEITQLPPVKSRVARRLRKRIVYSFDITGKDGKDVRFRTKVEAGMYIRKLVHDIGEKLKVGAHMKELRRTKVGHFVIEDSHSLEDIERARKSWGLEKILIPIEDAIPHIKKVWIKDSAVSRIRNGSPVFPGDLIKAQGGINPEETIGIFSIDDRLVALGLAKKSSRKILKTKRGSIVRTDRVFLSKG